MPKFYQLSVIPYLPLFLLAFFGALRVCLDRSGKVIDHGSVCVQVGEGQEIDENADTVALGERLRIVAM